MTGADLFTDQEPRFLVTQQHQSKRSVHSTGFIVLDLLVAGDNVEHHVGGTAANVAVNLSLLGWKASVSGLLGDDPAGHVIRRQLGAYGVDTTALIIDGGVETPIVIHDVTKRRHRFRFSCPECGTKYAKFRPLPPGNVSTAPSADVHFFDRASSYALEIARKEHERSVIVFEPGTPGRPAATSSLARLSHLYRASGDLDLPNETVAATASKAQVIGLGSDGVKYRAAMVKEWRHRPSHVSGLPVDAGGAGDWVTAALLDGFDLASLKSNTVESPAFDAAIERALDFAAACCGQLGTRGFVGTAAWKNLTVADNYTDVADRSHLQSISESRGCSRWFHHPKQK